MSMLVAAISDHDLDQPIDSGSRREDEVDAGVAGLGGRLPLYFYCSVSRHAASST